MDYLIWVARLTRNVEVVGSSPIKGAVVSLSKKRYPYCLVLVGFRNGFERVFTIEFFEVLMEDWLKCQMSPQQSKRYKKSITCWCCIEGISTRGRTCILGCTGTFEMYTNFTCRQRIHDTICKYGFDFHLHKTFEHTLLYQSELPRMIPNTCDYHSNVSSGWFYT